MLSMKTPRVHGMAGMDGHMAKPYTRAQLRKNSGACRLAFDDGADPRL